MYMHFTSLLISNAHQNLLCTFQITSIHKNDYSSVSKIMDDLYFWKDQPRFSSRGFHILWTTTVIIYSLINIKNIKSTYGHR